MTQPFYGVRWAWLRTVAMNLARSRYRRRMLFDRLVHTGRVERRPGRSMGCRPTTAASPAVRGLA